MELKNMNNIVLVPTDFSEVCENALYQAAQAARFLGYKVMLLHVIDSNTKAYLKKEGKGHEIIESKLDALAAMVKKEIDVDIALMTREGDIFTAISEAAVEIGANLVYLGTHGKSGMQKLTGSFALRVVTSSPSPVIVVQKRKFEKSYKEIVMPITSEAGPWEKTQWAVFIAKEFGARIHLVMVNNAPDEVKDAATKLMGYFDKNGVEYMKAEVEKGGNFSGQVIDYATAKNADMMMIMTNPNAGFTSFLLGSYDEQIMFNTSQIPVMCINPRKLNYQVLGFK